MASKRRKTTKNADLPPAKRKSTKQRKQDDPVWATTNPNSELVYEDLHAKYSNPETYKGWSKEDWEEIHGLLPEDVTFNEDGYSVSMTYFKYDPTWRRLVREFQEDLGAGRYEPAWQKAAAQAMAERARGDFDQYKENQYEAFWGQKQKHDWTWLAGEASKIKLGELLEHGTIQSGDEMLYRRVFGVKRESQWMVEKEMKVVSMTDVSMTLAIPPGQQRFARVAYQSQTEEQSKITVAVNPYYNEMKNLVKTDPGHGASSQQAEQALTEDGIPALLHPEATNTEQIVEPIRSPPPARVVVASLPAATTRAFQGIALDKPGEEHIPEQTDGGFAVDTNNTPGKQQEQNGITVHKHHNGDERTPKVRCLRCKKRRWVCNGERPCRRCSIDAIDAEGCVPEVEMTATSTKKQRKGLRRGQRRDSRYPFDSAQPSDAESYATNVGTGDSTLHERPAKKLKSQEEALYQVQLDGCIHVMIESLQRLQDRILEIDGRISPKEAPVSSVWKAIRVRRNNQDLGTLFDMRHEYYVRQSNTIVKTPKASRPSLGMKAENGNLPSKKPDAQEKVQSKKQPLDGQETDDGEHENDQADDDNEDMNSHDSRGKGALDGAYKPSTQRRARKTPADTGNINHARAAEMNDGNADPKCRRLGGQVGRVAHESRILTRSEGCMRNL